jgi:hypothetical protein
MDRVRINSTRRSLFLISAISLFFLVGAITFLIPAPSFIRAIESLPQTCPLRRFTGLQCAFCGMTHAWIYFWHGEFAQAFQENRLALPLFLGAPISLFACFSAKFRGFWTESRIKTSVWLILAVLVSYTIFRNLNR